MRGVVQFWYAHHCSSGDELPARCVFFQLEEKVFGKEEGRSRGPSGMTSEHLRPLLGDIGGMKLLFTLGENLSRGHVPQAAVEIRAGRMTAHKKDDGGVRGIVVGDMRRLVARLCPNNWEWQRPPFTNMPCLHDQCVVHVLQG